MRGQRLRTSLHCLWLLALMSALAPAYSQVTSLGVTPTQVNASLQITFPGGVALPPVDPSLPPGSPVPLRDLLPPGTLPQVTFSPSSFTVTWDPVCSTLINTIGSPRGEFRLAGIVVGTTGLLPAAGGCDNVPGLALAPETVRIPNSVRLVVARRLLATPVQPPGPGSTTVRVMDSLDLDLVYTRRFEDLAMPGMSATNSVAIALASNLNATLSTTLTASLSELDTVTARAVPSRIAFDPRRLAGGPVPVAWDATVRRVSGLGSMVSVESTELVLMTGSGEVLRRVPIRLAGGPLTEGTATLSENLVLTSADLRAAADAGGTTLVAMRRFGDGRVTREASTVVAAFTSASSAGFAVTRLELRFCDSNRKIIVVEEGDEVCVEAEINYNGSGQFRGRWLVAGPLSPGGVPFYRTQRIVSEYSFGLRRHTLRLSGVPSPRIGRYLVRLELDEPVVDAVEAPVLTWFAGVPDPDGVAGLPALDALRIVSPGPEDELVAGQTRVSWQEVAGAAEYRVEVYDTLSEAGMSASGQGRVGEYPSALMAGESPAAGIVVPGGARGVAWSRLTEQRLGTGARYWWRVVAIDATGAVLATSAMRELHRQGTGADAATH